MKERTVSIEELEKGMLISADVHTGGGVVVVPQNTVVNSEVLNLLARHSIMEVSVKENTDGSVFSADDMDVLHGALDMLDYLEERANKQETFEDTFKFAKMEVKTIFDRLIAGEEVDIYVLLEIVAMVVAKADNDVNLFHMLYQKMNQGTEDLYIHSINVSLYAQLLAKWVQLTAEEVELAGLAGLLHDIGLLVCRKEGEKNITLHGEYTNKCGKDHMVHSYNIVKDMDIDVRLKQAILTHHERMDLSGFPNKLSYKSLNYISRVVAIADAFATLTMKEPGFKAMQPLDALCYMFDRCYIKFDTEMLINFIEHVVRNFMQYEVLLSDGQRGKIVMANKKEPARPVIMVGDQIVDLAIRKDLSIKEMYY